MSQDSHGAALVCRESRGGNEGGATFWFVRLPDGYLVACGFDGESEHHPDVGGNTDLAARANQAIADARREMT